MRPRKKLGAFTLVEVLVVVVIVAILAACLLGAAGGCSNSDGARVGTLTKFSKKGIVSKTYEGELTMGSIQNGAANVWPFSVTSPELAKKLESMVGKTVKIKYRQTLIHNPFTRDTSYDVVEIEEVAQ